MSGTPHDNGNANRNDDANDFRNPEQYGQQHGQEYGQERPQAWGGGEYDADATAFVQLPPELTELPPQGSPLAAPGTGQGGYTPPAIDPAPAPPTAPPPGATPAHGVPMTPAASTDPSAPGHWTLPFAAPGTDGGDGTGREPEAGPEPGPDPADERQGPAAVLGQGAAAALAGSHEARTQRRPLGEGGGSGAGVAGTGTGTNAGAVAEPWHADPAAAEAPAWGGAAPPAPGALPEAAEPAPGPAPGPLPAAATAAASEPAPEPTGEAGPEPESESGPGADAVPLPGPSPAEDPYAPNTPAVDSEHPHTSYVLHVNGVDRPVTSAWIGESLLYVLRERLGLAGAKDGCAQGECGACSVKVDGRLVASCLVPAATTAGSEVRTVEGLAANGTPSDVQCALAESGSVQCGFCVPGLAMTVHDLLEGNHAPSELETRQAISGNLCRCSGYRGVLDAVHKVVADRARAASAGEADEQGAAIPQQARNPEWGGA